MSQRDSNGRVSRQSSESEELHRLIAEHSTDMISKHTPEGIYTYASPACRSLLGYEPEDLVGHDAYEYLHPEDSHEIRKAHSAILKLPGAYTVAYRIRGKDGTYTWFETTSKMIWDAQTNEVKEIIAVSRDVTERKRAEDTLRYQLELTGTITKNAADALFILNPEGRITFTNPASARIFGWSQEELVGEVLHDKVHHHRPDRSPYPLSECPLNMVLTSGQTLHDHEDVFFHKDGSPVFVAYSSAPIVIEGQVTGLVVVRDVTERKQAEEQLRKSNQRVVSILESITEDFYALDTEWRFTYLNQGTLAAIRRAKGAELKREDLLGKNMWELFPELVGTEFYRKYHEAMREHKTVHVEAYSALRDAWVEAHAYPSEEGLSIYLQDITERKQAEEALRESREALRKSEEFHRFAAEAGRIGTWDLNLQTEECLISPKMAELMGFSPNQTIVPGPQWREAIVPDDRTLMESALAASIESDTPLDLEFRVGLKGGTERWLYSRGGVSRDASGKALRVHGASIDVTERKRIEEDLRRSNRRIANILESITDAFFAVDGDWRFTYVNRQAEQAWQRSREELLGKNLWEEFPEAVGSMFYEKYRQAAQLGTPVYFEEFYAPLGICVEVHAYPTGEGLAVYFQDITERKQVEEKLRESEERFRATFEQAAVGVAHNALDGRWLRVNQKLCEILGYSRDELLQKAFQDITYPDDVEPNLNYLRRLLSRDLNSFSMEKRYIRKDASIVWGELTVSLVRKPSGEPDYLISVVEDISDRKRAEEQLRFGRALLEAQTETSVDGILVVSSGGEMLSYNQRFVEMWDMPEEVLSTRSDEAALEVAKDKAADPQGFMTRVNYLYEHPSEESQEEIQLKDGRTFDRYSAPVTGADGTHYGRVWYFRDITRHKRAEESLLEIREAERRRIARDLHDAVLQDLSGALQGLQAIQVEFDSTEQKANLKQETDALRRAVGGLRGAVHDLRQEKAPSFVKAVESLVEYNRQVTPERQIRLNVQEGFPHELPEAVKVELLRTVQEALTNARRHSEARWTGVRLRKDQDKVCIEVVDDGRGFDPESARQGFGLLGMRERIASISGELVVRSDRYKGTMVCASVPTHVLDDEEMSP